MDIIAHRASYSTYPENSLEGILHSYNIGCSGIEMDVKINGENEMIIIHDQNTLRTLGKDYDVSTLSNRQCEEMNILLFWDVIELMRKFNKEREFMFFIDMKDDVYDKILLKMLEEDYKYIILQTSSKEILKGIRKLDKRVKIAYLIEDYENICSIIDNKDNINDIFDILSINYKLLSIDFVKYIKELNKLIFTWTIDDTDYIFYLQQLDIDYICTGYPEKFI